MILLFGPPGSGKSTQAQLLEQKYGLVWFSMGELLRQSGLEAVKAKQLKGELVDDALSQAVLGEALNHVEKGKIVLLDGYPRRESQVQWLLDYLNQSGRKMMAIVNIYIPLDVTLARNLSRGRPDDNEQVIKNRYREYEKDTNAVIYKLEEQGYAIKPIDGIGSVEEVHGRICQTLDGIINAHTS